MPYFGKHRIAPSLMAPQRSPLGALLMWPSQKIDLAFLNFTHLAAHQYVNLLISGQWYKVPKDIDALVPLYDSAVYVVTPLRVAFQVAVLGGGSVQFDKYTLQPTDSAIVSTLAATITINDTVGIGSAQFLNINHVHVSVATGDITLYLQEPTYGRQWIVTLLNDLQQTWHTEQFNLYGPAWQVTNSYDQLLIGNAIPSTPLNYYEISALSQAGNTVWSVGFEDPSIQQQFSRQLRFQQMIWDTAGNNAYILFGRGTLSSYWDGFWLARYNGGALEVVFDQQVYDPVLQVPFISTILEISPSGQIIYLGVQQSDGGSLVFSLSPNGTYTQIDQWPGTVLAGYPPLIHRISDFYVLSGYSIVRSQTWSVVKNLRDYPAAYPDGFTPVSIGHTILDREGFLDSL